MENEQKYAGSLNALSAVIPPKDPNANKHLTPQHIDYICRYFDNVRGSDLTKPREEIRKEINAKLGVNILIVRLNWVLRKYLIAKGEPIILRKTQADIMAIKDCITPDLLHSLVTKKKLEKNRLRVV